MRSLEKLRDWHGKKMRFQTTQSATHHWLGSIDCWTCELRSDKNSYRWPCSVDRSRTVGDARVPANVCLWRPAAWTNRREHLIVRIGISEAETTNNKRHALVVLYWMLVAMLRVCITDTKHRAASLLQQSFLFSQLLWVWFNCQCNQLPGKLIFTVACYVSSVALNLLPRSTLYFLGNL